MTWYRRFLPYAVAIASTTIALLLSLGLEAALSRIIGAFFYIAVATTAWYGGWRPGILAIVLSMLALNYYFMPPLYQLQVGRVEDVFQLTLFTIVSLIITLLSTNLQASRHKVEHLNRQLVRESTDRLRTALNAAQTGMWDWNLTTGKINWSPEHELLFDLPPGTFDGQYATFEACLHPDDRDGLN
jgi:K+-sensing histidine kinase KdpD